MSVTPVSTNAQSQLLLQQILQAENAVNNSEAQVASGKVATDYTGMGSKTDLLEATQSMLDRTNGYQSATQLALSQVNLQDSQLSQLSDIANQLRQIMTQSVANND